MGEPQSAPHAAFSWLTPGRCRLILAAVLLFGFLSHLHYLTNDCPIDLSDDEAHYWDWSRQLDYAYYSKGPLVAWVIRASTSIFGSTMPAVRLPALLIAMLTSLLTYDLTRRLFGSEKLALGAVLLNHVVLMFIAGSVLMTIDPPFFLCWAGATWCAAVALFRERKRAGQSPLTRGTGILPVSPRAAGRPMGVWGALAPQRRPKAIALRKWAWIACGLCIGLGILAKYGMVLWPLCLLAYLVADRSARHWLRTPWPYVASVIALLFLLPALFWNARHGWVTFGHVSQHNLGGPTSRWFNPLNILDLVGTQVGALGPPLAIVVIAAATAAIRGRADLTETARRRLFLACIGLSFLAFCFLTTFKTKVQANWPAPAYFTLLILSAEFLATRLADPSRRGFWRGCLIAAILLAIPVVLLAHHMHWLYRPVNRIGQLMGAKSPIRPAKFDPTYRLRGWKELGAELTRLRQEMGGDAMILSDRYGWTAQAAFYTQGQPRTYYLGSWLSDPRERGRLSQYDMWPDRNLDRPDLRGRDALYVGQGPGAEFLRKHFESVDSNPIELKIEIDGVFVRSYSIWRCRGFRGIQRPAGTTPF